MQLALVLEVLSVLLLAGAVLYAAIQLKLIERCQRENHDLNRRLAAQDAAFRRNERISQRDRELIESTFHYMERRDPIPLRELVVAFEEDDRRRSACHSLLNYHEALARGVRQGIYDEAVVEAAFRTIMERASRLFTEYILHRRSSGSPKAWIDTERLLQDWADRDMNGRREPPA